MALKASDIVRKKNKKLKSSGVKGKKNALVDWIGSRRLALKGSK